MGVRAPASFPSEQGPVQPTAASTGLLQCLPRRARSRGSSPRVANAQGIRDHSFRERQEIEMAEGLLGGMLGGEDEAPEVAPGEAVAGADGFAAAVAARLSAGDPGVARDTSAFLKQQAQLLETQRRHLEDEHAARLQYLRGQAREVDIRRFGLRLRVGFQVFVALIATVIGIGAALLIRDAVTSRRVVIEPFDAPSALAGRGLTGKVVAAGLLGELNRLQAATKSSAAKRDLTNAWSADVQLALPEAGVSIGELSRLLKRRFGHDLHIEGDLVQTEAGGLELTVRGDGVQQKTFSGKANELPRLTTQAAEYAYGQSEPALYSSYLSSAARDAEAIAFCQAAYNTTSKSDRPYLLNSWAIGLQNTGGSTQQALALYRAAVQMKPDFWVGYSNIQNALWLLGDEEGAWRAAEDMRRAAGGRPGRAPEKYYGNWDTLTWNLPAWRDLTIEDAESSAGVGTFTGAFGPTLADVYARMHDAEAAELALQTTKADTNDPSIEAITHFVRGLLAVEAHDSARAVTEMEAFQASFANPIVSSNYPGYTCWIAPVEEAAGHPDKADAVLAAAGTIVDCYRFRGDIRDGRGDWAGAQQAYAAAAALAPDLPAGYYSWGVALDRHGDLAGAEAKFKQANQRGPHWADPLKAWGDVLVQQGHPKEALAKYDEALKYAPNWKQLKEAREAAAKLKT
jgi:tetratricopeptide (TPR) repeat protein